MECINQDCNENSEQEKGHWFNDDQDDYWICKPCEIAYQEFKAKSKAELKVQQKQKEKNLVFWFIELKKSFEVWAKR